MTIRSARARTLAPLALALLTLAGCKKDPDGPPTPPATCTLSPGSPLRVVQMNPAPGSQYVSVTATVSLRFNTCLDLSTVSSQTVELGEVGAWGLTTPVAVAQGYDPRTATLSLDPTANLRPDTTYRVTVFQTVKGAHGEAQTAPYQQSFHTRATPDVTAPTTSASPGTGRYHTPQHVTLACSDGADGGGCARTYFTVDGTPPTPASPVYASPIAVTHDLTIRFFSVDFDGNAELPRSASYVIDTVPPTIVWIDPQDGATGVPRTVRIRARFSEPMAPWSLNATSITMSPSPERSYHWELLDGDVDTLTIVPRRRLECGTVYTLTFGAGARDVAGNGLAAPVTSSFTVHADCEEPVTTASLQDGVYATSPQTVTLTCTDGAGSGCARIVYTLDGTMPSFHDDPTTPPDERNGTVVNGASAGPLSIGIGDTVLRFQAEDVAGNLEVVREERYSISTTGFTWVATGYGLARGMGPVPSSFVTLEGAGLVAAFFRDPTNGRLYRAAERGLYASDDGVSWSRSVLVDDRGVPQRATAVYAQGSLVFVGTSGGLYRSEDGGATFQYLDHARVHPPWIVDVAGDGKDVYAAGNEGIRVSHDRGESFVETDATVWFADLEVDHARGLVFVGSNEGLRVSALSGGASRVYDATSGLPSSSVNAVAVTPDGVHVATAEGLAIFARDLDGYPSGTPTVRNYVDGLGTWGGVESVVVEEATGTIYARTEAGYPPYLYRSTTGGATWTALSLTQPTNLSGKAYGALYLDGSDLCVGATPGWYLSSDGGATFTEKDLPSVVRIAQAGGKLYAASSGSTGDDGLLVSTDGFRTFAGRGERHGMGPDGGSVNDLAVDGLNVYAATDQGLAISTDGGSTFVLRTRTSNGLWTNSIDCVAVQPGKIWACASNSLDVSTDGGSSFQSEFRISAGVARAVAASGSYVYYANTTDVRYSTDGGATAFQLATGLGAQPQDLALAPGGNVYVATGNGAFVSTDRGATFSALAGVTGTTWVYSVDATSDALYVGLGNELGISTDGGQTFAWRDATHGLTGTPKDTLYQP
ncbi:MAG TPA: Ig-like domain-containing protein [Anaeromyxobacter sp.]|nr:Ig-like domain-containing protein [Anaeromyxobacter sp.]